MQVGIDARPSNPLLDPRKEPRNNHRTGRGPRHPAGRPQALIEIESRFRHRRGIRAVWKSPSPVTPTCARPGADRPRLPGDRQRLLTESQRLAHLPKIVLTAHEKEESHPRGAQRGRQRVLLKDANSADSCWLRPCPGPQFPVHGPSPQTSSGTQRNSWGMPPSFSGPAVRVHSPSLDENSQCSRAALGNSQQVDCA